MIEVIFAFYAVVVDGSAIVGTGCAGFVAKERYFKRKRTGLGSYVVGIRN